MELSAARPTARHRVQSVAIRELGSKINTKNIDKGLNLWQGENFMLSSLSWARVGTGEWPPHHVRARHPKGERAAVFPRKRLLLRRRAAEIHFIAEGQRRWRGDARGNLSGCTATYMYENIGLACEARVNKSVHAMYFGWVHTQIVKLVTHREYAFWN
jgi:hypothetical protein